MAFGVDDWLVLIPKTSDVTNFDPQPDNTVFTLSVYQNKLITGGQWNFLGNTITSARLAIYDLPLSAPYQVTDAENKKDLLQKSSANRKNKNILWNAIISSNPALHHATVRIFGELHNYTVSVVDINGKTVWQKTNLNERAFLLPLINFIPVFIW